MVKVECEGALTRLTLNRPEVRNAFNEALIEALCDAFANLSLETRVVIIRGEGRAFCSGGDLDWMRRAAQAPEAKNREDALRLAGLFQAIATCRVPVIAQVHGAAFGGACGLVAASDIAIASSETLFAFSEVRLGLVPATISPFVLAKIGSGSARALFTTGEAFSASRALQIGLVQEVVSTEDLESRVLEKVNSILKSGPLAVAESKLLAQKPPLSASDSADLLARVRAGEEAQEGISAFLEKRTPGFSAETKRGEG
ncbi:MAG: enoyl-CoA hydratase-related protein [Fimbriimonadaceae bacterium]|jgi:enoyl-CoA hydratase/carnithine racemase|nr:enoyl-CoA hydratase-related protein [Fimbriimonadaceae bacterium]